MGREVEQAAKSAGFDITAILNSKTNTGEQPITEAIKDAEVCIDFSTPAAVLDNIKTVAGSKKSMVVGTTGWYDKLGDVKEVVRNNDIGLVYAPNFSIGVNIFFNVVERAASLMNRFSDYDPYIIELHHNQKADSPSGTALQLGKILLENLQRKKDLLTNAPKGKPPAESLSLSSIRVGHIFGTHIVGFDSSYDHIELKHEAKSRRGFALGALLAAEWVRDKKGLFTFMDVLKKMGE